MKLFLKEKKKKLLPKAPNSLLTDMGMVRKGFRNVPLKDLKMERKKVEEFEESLYEDCG